MHRIVWLKARRKSQAGFSLLELLMACIVLTTGLLGIMGIFALAIGNNGRSKVDTTATMLAQSVLEQIAAVNSGGGPNKIWDCNGKMTEIAYTEGGAPLKSNGDIDFNAPAPTGSPAFAVPEFAVCTSGTGSPNVYDVRWNITQAGYKSFVVTVGARPVHMTAGRFTFSLPVTLRLTTGGNL
jgi:hypothetical protein